MAPDGQDDELTGQGGLPSWMAPTLPKRIGASVTATTSLQFNKRSCMAAVAAQLRSIAPGVMPLRKLQEATGYDAAEIGSCLVKLQQDGRVRKLAPPANYKNGASYGWNDDAED